MTKFPAAPEPSWCDQFRDALRELDAPKALEVRQELGFGSGEPTDDEIAWALGDALRSYVLRLRNHPATARTDVVITAGPRDDLAEFHLDGRVVGHLEPDVVAQIRTYTPARPAPKSNALDENVLADAQRWGAGGNDTSVDTVTEQIRLVRRFGVR